MVELDLPRSDLYLLMLERPHSGLILKIVGVSASSQGMSFERCELVDWNCIIFLKDDLVVDSSL